jgi:hypothetical protein
MKKPSFLNKKRAFMCFVLKGSPLGELPTKDGEWLCGDCFFKNGYRLQAEEKSLLREYERMQNEYLSLAREDAFKNGFSMGLQLSAEAFLRE